MSVVAICRLLSTVRCDHLSFEQLCLAFLAPWIPPLARPWPALLPSAMPRARFLSAVLRPFPGDSELEIAARRSLEEKLDKTDPDAPLLDEAAARFEAADARSPKLGRVLRWGLLVGAVATVFWPASLKMEREMSQAERIVSRIKRNPFESPPSSLTEEERESYIDFLFPGATLEQKLLLSANSTERAKALWQDRYPDDPAIYYHYVRRHLAKPGGLPTDFLATAERLDPDNGYAPFLAMAQFPQDAVKWKLPGGIESSVPPIQVGHSSATCTVEDENAFREAIEFFSLAASKSEFDDRRSEFLVRCLANLPPPQGDSGYMVRPVRTTWIGQELFRSHDIVSFVHFNRFAIARSTLSKESGDKKGLSGFARQWLDFMPIAVACESPTINQSIWQSTTASSGRRLLDDCRELGLDEEVARLEPPVLEARSLRVARIDSSEEKIQAILCRTGLLGRQDLYPCLEMIGNQLETAPMDLTADRLASYTIFESLIAHAGVVMFMLVAGICVFGWFRLGRLDRTMGRRLSEGLTPADWAWIVVGGIFVPLAWHGLATRIPAFHGRAIFLNIPIVKEYVFAKHPEFTNIVTTPAPINIIAILQCFATLFFIVTSVVWIAGRRVALRGRVLGFGRRRFSKWFGWTGPLAAALALPACALPAIVFDSGEIPESRHLLPAAILLGYAALWLLVVFGRAVFGLPSRGLERATVARALVPAFLCAAIAVGVAGRFAAAEHRHWLALDPFGVADPQYGGITKYEYRTTRWLQERLLSSFRDGTAPKTPSSNTSSLGAPPSAN